eukprot:scaffold4423_cov344-Prasinococcus_capsulatus_cf.AAC.5
MRLILPASPLPTTARFMRWLACAPPARTARACTAQQQGQGTEGRGEAVQATVPQIEHTQGGLAARAQEGVDERRHALVAQLRVVVEPHHAQVWQGADGLGDARKATLRQTELQNGGGGHGVEERRRALLTQRGVVAQAEHLQAGQRAQRLRHHARRARAHHGSKRRRAQLLVAYQAQHVQVGQGGDGRGEAGQATVLHPELTQDGLAARAHEGVDERRHALVAQRVVADLQVLQSGQACDATGDARQAAVEEIEPVDGASADHEGFDERLRALVAHRGAAPQA